MYDYEQKLKIQIHFIDVVQLKVDYQDVIYVSMWSRPPNDRGTANDVILKKWDL